MKIILINDLTEQQARDWLFANDKWLSRDSVPTLERMIERITEVIKEDFREDIDEQDITIGFQVSLRPMKRYKVTATMYTDLYTHVNAYDEEHALRLASDIADIGGMQEEAPPSGDLEMGSAYEITDGENDQ